MKKRWFVVILTIGLLLHILPLSVLALSPDPTITDPDGTILDWSDLSTVPYSLDDLQEQEPPCSRPFGDGLGEKPCQQ